uniref:Integrase core domain containing protein n=1 Tax=Solanum tuberosum TaxID=4113 RepID=M1DYC7_SOLTU
MNGVRRSQDTVENGQICGLEIKECLKPGIDPIHETPSMDCRSSSLLDALEYFTKCETTEVDYGTMASKKLVTYIKRESQNLLPLASASSSKNGYTSGSVSAHASGSESSHNSGFESAHAAGSIAKSATSSDKSEQMVSLSKADNQLTWNRVVIVVALVARLEIDFPSMLVTEIHEKASFEMRQMWRHHIESPRLRYLPWAQILQTRWSRHMAVIPLNQATPILSRPPLLRPLVGLQADPGQHHRQEMPLSQWPEYKN